jgi:hypothetical protein
MKDSEVKQVLPGKGTCGMSEGKLRWLKRWNMVGALCIYVGKVNDKTC